MQHARACMQTQDARSLACMHACMAVATACPCPPLVICMYPHTQGVRTILPREKRFFWMAMMLATLHWVLAFVIALFSFSTYIIVAILGVLFSGSNLYGYFKCSREAQADLNSYINSTSNNLMQGAIKQQLNQAVSRV